MLISGMYSVFKQVIMSYIRGLSKNFVEFVNKNKSTSVVAIKLLHV